MSFPEAGISPSAHAHFHPAMLSEINACNAFRETGDSLCEIIDHLPVVIVKVQAGWMASVSFGQQARQGDNCMLGPGFCSFHAQMARGRDSISGLEIAKIPPTVQGQE